MSRIDIPTLHTGEVDLPRETAGLYDLAYNLWWAWSPRARRLFATIDVESWGQYRNPVQMLLSVEPERWQSLVESEAFMSDYRAVMEEFEGYLQEDGGTWWNRQERPPGAVAYFSMEYGLDACLALYSGGLGVLSGDHCKSASDLGVPFVAVGLLYRHGYFHQTITADGIQQHHYPKYDFHRLPLLPAASPTGREVVVEVPLLDRSVAVKVWVAKVGRVPLLFLDTDLPENDPADRPITDILYIRGREMRLVQELVLGIGGVRALEALGVEPAAWHLNEGHCALLQLERLRRLRAAGQGFEDAVQELVRTSVFTTHTPVPAGNEVFEEPLARRYLNPWARELGVSVERLLDLGDAARPGTAGGGLNLTALGLKTSHHINGVSRLNAQVVDRMWRHLFPEAPAAEQVITGVTNGVHTGTWLGPEMRALLEAHLGPRWQELLLEPKAWGQVLQIPDAEIWRAHQAQKGRLGRFLRSRLRGQLARHGAPPDELRRVAEVFDPEVLTLGFARRFATYKRADLIFSDLVRLRKAVAAEDRPVQILFAGKAHPADQPGQELIRHIFHLSRTEQLEGRVFFLENYDMRVGAMLVQGVDVWLNTPRRPLEASGTSGQKAAANGALNLSILDGWWPESYDGSHGWAIGEGDGDALAGAGSDPGRPLDEAQQDREDAGRFYRLLEEEVVPAYYSRGADGLPTEWIRHMKHAIAAVTPRFSSSRMVRDYAEQAYLPTLVRAADRSAVREPEPVA